DEWAEEETEVFFCIFEMQDAADIFENMVLADKGELTEEINKILTIIEAELKGKAAFLNDRINLLLEELIIILKRMIQKVDVKYDIVEYVKRLVKQNSSRGMNFQAIAESVGYSYDRFRHIFKEKTGISPTQYHINVRIAKAKALLKNSDTSVAKISEICGFKDVHNFISTFKIKVGITPLKYRQAVSKATDKVLNFNECL
ncbi:MAG: AraC family transcriptional regulator, partial [Oscillospiraceae bacterium]|nr:AraC family transcriptional regulator [Oscillospiraceae bacterium]